MGGISRGPVITISRVAVRTPSHVPVTRFSKRIGGRRHHRRILAIVSDQRPIARSDKVTRDRMIEEMQELGLAGHTAREAYDTLRARHDKVPTLDRDRKSVV